MTDASHGRWKRIGEVFAAALAQPPESRGELLDRECGSDPGLRAEVESLLAHHRDDDFLGQPATAEARRVIAGSQPELGGQRLGRFEVLGRLGAGGMGEVYLARDPMLERQVALKLLPPHLAADPDRIRRFRREALALSALNHPNILTVHEVLEVDGREVLVSELIEGVTLRDRLRKGPLPVAMALAVATQIARGLEAAHRLGIVHRDVKPENVMLRDDGLVKVLDFGIAKSPARAEASDITHSPTHVPTLGGVILGTTSYMSPEQARGEPATRQTDVWALGCVLYEALCGQQAFPGGTVTEVLAAILTREPSWGELPEETPLLVRSLLRRCLAKSLDQRLHDVVDARLDLEESAREPVLAATAGGERRRRPSGPIVWGLAVAATGAVVALTFGAWQLGRSAQRGPALHGRFQLQPPAGVELVRSGEATLAISPDGRTVAFLGRPRGAAMAQLYLRRIDELAARAVAGTEEATNPFFSPDGEWLGFYSRGAIRKVAVAGGQPLVVCEVGRRPRGASWGEDGTIVFSGDKGLLRVAAAGGQPERLTTSASPQRDHRWPQHLPGGDAVLFQIYGGVEQALHEIAVHSLVTGEQRTLLRGGSYPQYAGGQLVFGRLDAIHAVPFDPAGLALGGEPRAALDDVWFFRGSSVVAFALSRDGAVVFSPGSPRLRDAELVAVDRQGRLSVAAARKAPYGYDVRPSPDGRRLAVFIDSSLEEADLWTYELAGERWTKLTADGRATPWAIWSRDGRWIFFSTVVQGGPKCARIASDGSGGLERLTSGPEWDYCSSLSPDGRFLLLARSPRAGDMDLLTVDLAGDRVPRPFLATPMEENEAELSPDGRHVVYRANHEGRFEIYVRPYPGPGAQVKVSSHGGLTPRWSPRGDEIFYRCANPETAASPGICAAAIESGAELAVGAPRRIVELAAGLTGPFAVAPDGQSFYMVRRESPEAATERRLVYAPDWIDELAGGIPARRE